MGVTWGGTRGLLRLAPAQLDEHWNELVKLGDLHKTFLDNYAKFTSAACWYTANTRRGVSADAEENLVEAKSYPLLLHTQPELHNIYFEAPTLLQSGKLNREALIDDVVWVVNSPKDQLRTIERSVTEISSWSSEHKVLTS